MLRIGAAVGSYIHSNLNLLRNLLFPKWLNQFIVPPTVNTDFLYSTLFPTLVFLVFSVTAILTGVR